MSERQPSFQGETETPGHGGLGPRRAEADAVAERMELLLEHELVDISKMLTGEAASAIVMPRGRTVQSLKKHIDEFRKVPERRKGTSVHRTLDSIIAHANQYKSPGSVLFANPGDGEQRDPVLLAVLNYNPAGPEQNATGWGDHVARYAFPLSEQWKAWMLYDGKSMELKTFAEFLEEHVEDIGEPDAAGSAAKLLMDKLGIALATPAAIMGLAKGLSIRVEHNVVNYDSLQTGETQLVFEVKHSDKTGAPLKLAAAFLINVPVFKGGAFYQLAVRLRYVPQERRVLFTFHLYREDLVFEHAFSEACKKAEIETALPLYVGSPE